MICLDCVFGRLNALRDCCEKCAYRVSKDVPLDDGNADAMFAGEFLEHLYRSDGDKSLCELRRVLSIGGGMLVTGPKRN